MRESKYSKIIIIRLRKLNPLPKEAQLNKTESFYDVKKLWVLDILDKSGGKYSTP